jgi:6-phosphogluconolactonase
MQSHTSIHKVRTKTALCARALSLIVVALLVPAVWAKDCLVYFGTFTDAASKGIYVSHLDLDSGKLSAPEVAAAVGSPNYLAISPDGHFLFAVTRGDKGDGAVATFSVDAGSGSLKLLDQKSSGGNGPCYVGLDTPDQAVIVANYSGGTVKSFHLNPDGTLVDGTIIEHHGSSVNPERQAGPHPHCFVPAPDGRFALACDLGLDKVMIYRVNPDNGTLTTNDPAFAAIAPGSGPRHIAFSPDGKSACVISEMACTATVFSWNGAKGKLRERQTVQLLPPGEYQKNFTAAEIAYRPDGRFVYATVRTHNSISVLAVDGKKLSLVQNLPCAGDFPRGMGIDPTGHWLIVGNQKSKTVTVFAIDAETGKLTYTGQSMVIGIPVDVKFLPLQ